MCIRDRQWVWIDTCCIDRSSSTELSEAINSMFGWYSRAEECYAFLSDVRCSIESEIVPETFSGSSWFLRGWTLQELIAPAHVIFLSQDWDIIGCKHPTTDIYYTNGAHSVTRCRLRKASLPGATSIVAYTVTRLYHDSCDEVSRPKLNNLLATITGVPHDVLADRAAVAHKSVAQKMSWASGRHTTKAEDRAYCLLGLFGINMPLLYGEGARAFTRFQHEIIRASCDETIFAWQRCFLQPFQDTPLLASAPDDFANAGQILRMKAFKRPPYTMTNQGLELKLHAHSKSYCWKGNMDHILVVLNCSDAVHGFGKGEVARYFCYLHLRRQSCDHYGVVFYGDNANPQSQLLERPEWEELTNDTVLYVHTLTSSTSGVACICG